MILSHFLIMYTVVQEKNVYFIKLIYYINNYPTAGYLQNAFVHIFKLHPINILLIFYL